MVAISATSSAGKMKRGDIGAMARLRPGCRSTTNPDHRVTDNEG